MKKLLCLLALFAMCFTVVPHIAKAEKVDMGAITCKVLMDMDEDEVTMLMFWYDGYVSHMTKDNVMDADAIVEALQALAKHCADNPGDNVLKLITQ